MIRTLQKKFIVTAMIAVTVLLLVLLGAINAVNAVSASRESDQLLELVAAQEGFGPAPRERPAGLADPGRQGLFQRTPNEDDRLSAPSFSVRFTAAGELESVDLARVASLTEEEAASLARKALASGRTGGRLGNRKFKIVDLSPDAGPWSFWM